MAPPRRRVLLACLCALAASEPAIDTSSEDLTILGDEHELRAFDEDDAKGDVLDLDELTPFDDDVEVYDDEDTAKAIARPERAPADTAVTVYDPRRDRPVASNWTHATVQALVERTPFLSSDGLTVFTGRLESDVVSEADLCDENRNILCATKRPHDAFVGARAARGVGAVVRGDAAGSRATGRLVDSPRTGRGARSG